MIERLLPHAVYLLCALTSIACAMLLLRTYRRNRQRLLLLVGLSFVALALNNVLLVVDLLVVAGTDLSLLRAAVGLAAMGGLLLALIWETG